jgi:predicted phosphodiesterase
LCGERDAQLTPRKGESRRAFQKRQAEYDATRAGRHQAPAADPAYVEQLEKEHANLTRWRKERLAEDRERELTGSMKFEPMAVPAADHKPGAPGMPMTLWSDWHWGETVDARETGGLNAFNREIAQARVAKLVNNTITLLRDYSGPNPEYPGIWVMLGGDMVSGLIHDELIQTNWGNIADQAFECAAAITGALLRMADEFGKVHVVGVVGNHGRTTRKPQAKGRALDSYDRSIYKSIAAKLAGDSRFTIVIPDDTDYLFSVYGHRFLLTHGDSLGVKGGDGIIGALGPIARGAVKLRNSEGQVGRDFDTLIMGHWHQYIPRGDALGVIVNGTLKGYDEYARLYLRARFAKPSQALWLVSPKHGIAAQWCVYV